MLFCSAILCHTLFSCCFFNYFSFYPARRVMRGTFCLFCCCCCFRLFLLGWGFFFLVICLFSFCFFISFLFCFFLGGLFVGLVWFVFFQIVPITSAGKSLQFFSSCFLVLTSFKGSDFSQWANQTFHGLGRETWERNTSGPGGAGRGMWREGEVSEPLRLLWSSQPALYDICSPPSKVLTACTDLA